MPKNNSPSIEANFIKIHDEVGNVVETENALGALFKVSLFDFILSLGKFVCHFLYFLKCYSKQSLKLRNITKEYSEIVRKSKAGPQNCRRFVRFVVIR